MSYYTTKRDLQEAIDSWLGAEGDEDLAEAVADLIWPELDLTSQGKQLDDDDPRYADIWEYVRRHEAYTSRLHGAPYGRDGEEGPAFLTEWQSYQWAKRHLCAGQRMAIYDALGPVLEYEGSNNGRDVFFRRLGGEAD